MRIQFMKTLGLVIGLSAMTGLNAGVAHAELVKLTNAEIQQRIIGRCWRSEEGTIQLKRNGTFEYVASAGRQYSYNGTYHVSSGAVVSNRGRRTRLFKSGGRYYAKFHGARRETQLRSDC